MAAPVDYAGKPYIGEAIAKKQQDGTNQFYLHEMEDKNKLASVFKTSSQRTQLGAPMPSRLILGQKADNVKRASKVVDDEGNPKRFYHGTGADFDTFDKSFQGQNYSQGNGGFSFTDQPRKAQQYAELDAMSRGLAPEQGKVHEVYLNMKNPYVHNVSEEYLSSIDHFEKDREWLLSEAHAKGHDGILVKGDRTNMAYVFEPTQIKSVHNRGTFNPNDPSENKGLIPLVAGGGLASAVLTPGEASAGEPQAIGGDPTQLGGLLGAIAQDVKPQAGGNPIQNELISAVHDPERVTWGDVKHGLSYGTRGVMEGVLGAPAGLLNMLSEPLTGYSFPNIGARAADALGLDRPQNDADRIVYGLGRGASEAVPYVAGGGALAKGGAGAVQRFGEYLADSPKAQALLGGLLGLFSGSE